MNDFPGQKLFLFGGGPKPAEAVLRFSALSYEAGKHIVIVAWASDLGEEVANELKKEILSVSENVLPFRSSLEPPSTRAEANDFLDQLEGAGGIFFSGGNQKKIIEVLRLFPDIADRLKSLYAKGVVFAGTSAGTAIMSEQMIISDKDPSVLCMTKVETGAGLGLMQNCIVDQHFLKRRRQNRLFSLILHHRHMLGVGVDEGAAFFIQNESIGIVIGLERVMIVDASDPEGSLKVDLIAEGEAYDLLARRKFKLTREHALASFIVGSSTARRLAAS